MPVADDDKDTASKKPKKSKKLLFILMPLILLLAGGGAAAYFLLFSKAPVPEEVAQVAEAAPAEMPTTAKQNTEAGVMFDFPIFVVNLSDPAGSRYLKVSLSAEISPKDKKLPDELTAKLPRIKDIIISVLSSKTYEEISTTQGKASLKDEIKRRINSVLTGGKLQNIYFTEFVVQ